MAELKTAVRYFSKSGNTKKVAEAIAESVGCEIKPIPEPVAGDVDILFLGASVYWGGVASEVKDYIPSLNKNKIGKVVIFSTSALAQRTFPSIKKLLQKQGIAIDEDNFYCRGQRIFPYQSARRRRALPVFAVFRYKCKNHVCTRGAALKTFQLFAERKPIA